MTNTSYTSPHTGNIYQCVPNTLWRQSWDAEGNPIKSWYTVFQYYLNDKLVTKTLSNDEKYLEGLFGEIEGVYAPWSTSRFD